LDKKDSSNEKIKKIKKFVIPGMMLSSLVLVIGIILGLIAAFGGNFLSIKISLNWQKLETLKHKINTIK
jgi:hypothetical protein